MRVECEHCRAVVEATWSVAEGSVRARCPACGETSTAAITRIPTANAADADGPECPKCGATVRGAACARCGLAASRMATWEEEQEVAPALAAAWQACLDAWDDAERHERAASIALTVGEQPWLARRYRSYLRDHPTDKVAAAGLHRVGRIAQAAVLASASTPQVSRFRRGSSYAVLGALVLAVVGGLLITLYLVRKNRAQDDAPRRAPATPVPPKAAPWQRPELRAPTAPPSLPDRRVESGPPRR